jgi:hypothetical protein
MTIIWTTHDMTEAFNSLGRSAIQFARLPHIALQVSTTLQASAAQLATAAIAFTIQLAIEVGRPPDEMRALERELIDAVREEL